MVAFDVTGSVRWSVPNFGPKIATADGGVIAQAWDADAYNFTGAAVTFDKDGNATGQRGSLPVQSWTGNVYPLFDGLLLELVQPPPQYASSFEAVAGGNPSGNATSVAFLAFIEGKPFFAAAGTTLLRSEHSLRATT